MSLKYYFHLTPHIFSPPSSCYEDKSELQSCLILYLVSEKMRVPFPSFMLLPLEKIGTLEIPNKSDDFPPTSPSPMMLWFAA